MTKPHIVSELADVQRALVSYYHCWLLVAQTPAEAKSNILDFIQGESDPFLCALKAKIGSVLDESNDDVLSNIVTETVFNITNNL